MRDGLKWLPLLFLIGVTAWLRLANLGYSDYQGDEIKALWRPADNESALEFLYKQKKGPVQFLVTYGMSSLDPTFSNQLLQRLPFALAGILAVFVFYKLVERHYGRRIAFYATALLSVNGIFVGLMRIIQYQPFVLLFTFLALYGFTLALQQEGWRFKGIYLGVLCWTLALFTHYDAVFIIPFAVYLLVRWYTQNSDLSPSTRLKHLLIPFAISGALLAVYFVPYLLSLPTNIKDYWLERITGEGDIYNWRSRSSLMNFKVYNPLLALYLYPVLGALSLVKIKRLVPLLIWFAAPWLILEVAIFDPGTHIYTYLLPAIIMAAFGLHTLEEMVLKLAGIVWGRRLNAVWLALLLAFLVGVSQMIFVDHTPEYPFEKRRILFWTVGEHNDEYKAWIYGFPYNRSWEDIREFVTTTEQNGFYATNENVAISDYYVPYKYNVERAGHYVYIHNPTSFRGYDSRDKIQYWRAKHEPIKVFEVEGRVMAEVYYMPSGSLEEIKKAGN